MVAQKESRPAVEESINTYDQLMNARSLGLPDVAITVARLPGRPPNAQYGWGIYRPGFQTDPSNDTWYAKGIKVFSEYEVGRAGALEAAKAWCAERYKVTGWVRNRMREYVDARVNKQFPLRKAIKLSATPRRC